MRTERERLDAVRCSGMDEIAASFVDEAFGLRIRRVEHFVTIGRSGNRFSEEDREHRLAAVGTREGVV